MKMFVKEIVVNVRLSVVHLRDCLQMPPGVRALRFEQLFVHRKVLQLAPRLPLGGPTSSFGGMVSLSLNASAS